jgi:hypothetical protein
MYVFFAAVGLLLLEVTIRMSELLPEGTTAAGLGTLPYVTIREAIKH